MSVDSLIGHLSNLTNLTPAFIEELKAATEVESYKPHQIVHAAGQVENRLWYLVTGFARTYYFDMTGKEHTISFYSKSEIIFSYKGYWKEQTDYYLEVVTVTILIALPYETLYRLMVQYEEATTLVRIITRQRYYQELFKSRLMTWVAEERYHQFRKNYPDVFKLASVRLIASYLNMTRENLSRLMGRET